MAYLNQKLFTNPPSSPCYVFHSEILLEKVRQIRHHLPHCKALCYAMKANPFLVQMLGNDIDRLEVCSPGEYEICHERGIDLNKIIVSGVNKTHETIARILSLSHGKGIYTIESPLHYEILSHLASEMDLHLNLLIRLSPGNQFGVDRKSLEDIMTDIQQDTHCTLQGIHFFSGTQKKMRRIEKELTSLNDYAADLKARFCLDKLELEYGPGLAVSYFADDKIDTPEAQLQALNELLGKMTSFDSIGIELGRFIAAECGNFLTKVIDIKTTDGDTYVILDGGFHQLHYFGQMMGMKIPPMTQFPSRTNEPSQHVILCGSLCSVNDVLVRDVEFHQLHIGDYLLFGTCGAYSMTESSALFLSRELPAVYECDTTGKLTCLRPQIDAYHLNTLTQA